MRNIHFFFLLVFTLLLGACRQPVEAPATVAGFTHLEDLDGHTVAVVTGSTSDVLLSDVHSFAAVNLLRFESPTDLFDAIIRGEADCGIADTVVLMNLGMNEHGLAVDFNLPGGFDVAAAFNKRNEKLCYQFNDFLVQIKANGTLDSMFARWCSAAVDTVAMPSLPELGQLKGHPYEVATLVDNPPFSYYKDNVWMGLEVEMMRRFSLYLGKPVHFSGYHFDEILGLLRAGQADMAAANMFITPDRSNQVLFSHPYYFCKTCCFSPAR